MTARESERPERPGSRLPQDQKYWDRLGARISQAAAPQIDELAQDGPWLNRVGELAPRLAAAAVVLLALGWAVTPARNAGPEPVPVSIVEALMPDDPLAGPLLAGRGPTATGLIAPAVRKEVP